MDNSRGSSKSKRKSRAWDYFIPEEGCLPSARCTICEAILKTSGGSTRGMLTHLERIHKIELDVKRSSPLQPAGMKKEKSGKKNQNIRCLSCYEEKAKYTSTIGEENDVQIKLENLLKLMSIHTKDVLTTMSYKNYSFCSICLHKVSIIHELMCKLANVQAQLSIKKNEIEEMFINSYNLSIQVKKDQYNVENIEDVFFDDRFKIVQKLGQPSSSNPSNNAVFVKQELHLEDNLNFDQEDISNNLPDMDSFEQNFPFSPSNNLLNDDTFFDQEEVSLSIDNYTSKEHYKVPHNMNIKKMKKACINLTPLPESIYKRQSINLKEEQYQSLLNFKAKKKIRIKWKRDKNRKSSDFTGQFFQVRKNSKVWYYFLQELGSKRAKCKICDRILMTTEKSTRGLITHLSALHNIDLKKYTDEELLSLSSNEAQFELSCSITEDCDFKTYDINLLQLHEKQHKMEIAKTKKDTTNNLDGDGGIFHAVTKKSKVWLYFLEEENSQRGKCKICNSIIKTSGSSTKGLLNHLSSKHNIDILNCPDDELPSIANLPPPLPLTKLGNACRYSIDCEYKTYSLSRLKSHEKKHDINFIVKGNKQRFRCTTCSKHFSCAEKLRIHERLHTKENPYLCTFCGKGFRAMEYLNYHLATHDRSLFPYKCTLCDKGYFRKRLLEEHLINHPAVSIDEENEVGSFSCKLCSRTFNSEMKINTHMLKHRVKNPICIQCNVKCNSSRELKVHIHKEHKGGEVLLCHVCTQEFIKESELNRHFDITHGDRKLEFQCPICKKTYERKNFLSIHLMSHTNSRPFKCKVCQKGFYTPYKLKIHENSVHSTLTPFQCQVCSKQFRVQKYLYMHMRVHKEETKKQQEELEYTLQIKTAPVVPKSDIKIDADIISI